VFSLWFVKIYLASRLVGISDEFVGLFAGFGSVLDDDPLASSAKRSAARSLRRMSAELDALGLPFTKLAADRLASELVLEDGPLATGRQFDEAFNELFQRFQDEVQQIRFLFVEPNKLKHYDQAAPFGAEVAQKFPCAEFDIREAANCFALGRYTATVMHCMRVLEKGLDALGKAVKAKKTHRGWGNDLNAFADAWEKQLKAKPTGQGWRRAFFPKAFADFRHFEFAWRNHAMHGHKSFGETEAEQVFEHVQSFMQHLATRLKETKRI
jgi:hypothetical protein